MIPELEKVLNTIGTSYDRSLKKRYPQPPAPQAPNVPGPEAPGNVPAPENEGPDEDEEAVLKEMEDLTPQEHKELCISALTARMENLEKDDPEYEECSFIAHALRNGWLVSDIPMLRGIHSGLKNAPEAFRPEAHRLLDQFRSVKMNRLTDRYQMLDLTSTFLLELGTAYPRYQALRRGVIDLNIKKTVYPLEYPEDDAFGKTTGKDPEKGIKHSDIFSDANEDAYKDLINAQAREGDQYTFNEITDRQREIAAEQPFVPNRGQAHNKMTIPASQAVREVLGGSMYDEIDEMGRGSLDERRVKLHHSVGTRRQKQGRDVLELEFAGSGGEDVLKYHKGRLGVIDDRRMTKEESEERFGIKAKKPGSNTAVFDYIRYREKTIETPEGKNATRRRYAFAGATPFMPGFTRGLLNLGDYSIENCRKYAKHYAGEFLGPRFDKWLSGEEEPKPIYIDISGHSRGAVTAGQAAKKIDEWIREYSKAHKVDPDQLRKYVHYDLRLYDPVPGMITDSHLGSCNLRNIPNVNCTVFCSLGIESPDFAFPLQHVKGAKKIVLTMTDHMVDTNRVDASQMNILGDGKKHALGYYDAETGEMHRGSGLGELPDGIYVSDENHNLIRITSYSQVNDLFGTVYDKTSPQHVRCRRINKMVRDWFIENELEMSFPDERTRKLEEVKDDLVQDKILKQDAKRLRSVKAEIEELRRLKKQGASKEELVRQNHKLIKACRDYMADTAMPPSGNSAYKVGLVSDTLSHTMRENNYLKKEIIREKGEAVEPGVDEKINAHRERLEKREGYLSRKREAETARLEQENKVLKLFTDTAKKCKDTLDALDKTRVGKGTSGSYDKFRGILEEGSKLGSQTSVSEMNDFLRRFNEASENYRLIHDSVIGPVTKDGKTRLGTSKDMKILSKDTAEELKKLSKGLGEKNTPIGLRIMDSSAKIKEIEEKKAKLAPNGPEVQKAAEINALRQGGPAK